MSHALFPPREPSVTHQGIWSPETRSVHVVDAKSMRALWEQGFYGKGNLSRSEPSWLRREQVRQGLVAGTVSELVTGQRRQERREMKWERARTEQEAIWKKRADEANEMIDMNGQLNGYEPVPPVGPLELLALPNSSTDLPKLITNGIANGYTPNGNTPNGHNAAKAGTNGGLNGIVKSRDPSTSSEPLDDPIPLKRQKSVRFSPKVESTTFMLSDPPSPHHAFLSAKVPDEASPEIISATAKEFPDPVTIIDKEHLQLCREEAFFLAFALGVLMISDPQTKSLFSIPELFDLFRQYSYLPPRIEPGLFDLSPDDPFLVQYAVYHHFRSLGWVPRPGMKFGVDWILYAKGPVFDHAEFGLMVIPSYTDSTWKGRGKDTNARSWHWLHGANRVLAHVKKSLVLVYVDVPAPSVFEEARRKGLAEVFKLYKVREVTASRWSSNRNRA
jgi:tRNA-splicing endonuclease subunit Sen2